MSPLASLILALGIAVPDPGQGWIHGVVQTERGEPLAGAVVSIVGVEPERTASTDVRGGYRLRAVPAGRHAVRVEALGYASLEVVVSVPADAGVELDFTLELRPVLLPPVDVNASARPTDVDTASVPVEPEVRLAGPAVNRTVAVAPGLIDVGFGRVPGRSGDPIEPTDALFVRGAAAELKRVLLDGAPVHSPYNVAGLLPPFATGTVGDGRLYLGGAPARYDGGLAYVLDLRTRDTRAAGPVHAEGAFDMLAGRMTVDLSGGPDAGAWFSGRVLHPWAMAGIGGGTLPYDYADFVGHADVAIGETGRLQATAFRNEEAVALSSGAGTTANWGNDAASVRLESEVAGATAEVTAGWGRFAAHLPVEATGFAEDAVSDHGRLVAEVRHGGTGDVRWSWGTSVERIHIRSGAVGTRDLDEAAGTHEVAGNAVGAYVESDWRPQPRLRVRTGVRLDHYTGHGGLRISPRVALTSILGDEAALTLAVGRYRQFVPVRRESEESPIVRRHLGTAHATHFVARMEQTPATGVRLGVEGYFKRFGGTGLEPPWARATASGLDLWLGLDRDRWSGWAGYSLEWTWAATAYDQPTTDRFAGRHLLSAGLTTPVGDATTVRVRIGYGAGLPYTAISTPQDRAGEFGSEELQTANGEEVDPVLDSPYDAASWIAPRSEPYLRLDAEASHDVHIAWGGRRTVLSPYVRVLNALGDRDGVFFRTSAGDPERLDPVDRYPVIPILGLRWRF
ncbi:MAG: TonB-dependent receptor [Gemmatimonadota bacterium]